MGKKQEVGNEKSKRKWIPSPLTGSAHKEGSFLQSFHILRVFPPVPSHLICFCHLNTVFFECAALSVSEKERAASTVLQVSLTHRQLFLPVQDLERPLLLGHLDTGPKYITLHVRMSSLLFKLPNSRFPVILWNTRIFKTYFFFSFYCLPWFHSTTFILPKILTPHFGEKM